MKTISSDAAFPIVHNNGSIEYGLTKREYFAAVALQGLLADPEGPDSVSAAFIAVRAADNLIKALNE